MPDDAMTDAELRQWAEKVKEHSAAARGVLRLLAERDQWIVIANQGVAITKELIAEKPPVYSGNDGKFWKDGKLMFDGTVFRGVPIEVVPSLDHDTTNPVYRETGITNAEGEALLKAIAEGRAESKKFDGSTGTPAHGVAGHKSEGTGS